MEDPFQKRQLPSPGSPPGSPGCALWWDMWEQSPGGSGFLASSLPDFLCRVSVSASPAQSPVFSHLASSLRGLETIRAYKAEHKFQKLFDAHQDLHSGLSVSGDDFSGWDLLPSEAWPSSLVAWLLPRLSVPPLIPLCTPASPTPSSRHPSVHPSSPSPPAFLPGLVCVVLPSLCPVVFSLFRARINRLFFFFLNIQI